MEQSIHELSLDSGKVAFYDVLRAVPFLWSLLGRQTTLSLRTVSREARNLHDAACLSLHLHLGRAASLHKSQLVGCAAIFEALHRITKRGCQPLHVTINTDCETMLCAALQESARSATRISILGCSRMSVRLGATLTAFAPQVQHLVLELSETGAVKGADVVLAAIGSRLRALELRVGSHGTLPAVSLEECKELEDLRLVLDMHTLAPLGPLRMRGDEAPPAVSAIASLGNHLRSLELVGSALRRLLDPPHRMVGLSGLTALSRLRVDMPSGFLAPPSTPVERAGGGGGSFASGSPPLAAALAAEAAELRWRAVPLAASLGSLAEVHLGKSYELTVYDMMVLARAQRLTVLACRNIVLPPTLTYDNVLGRHVVRVAPPPEVPLPPSLRELQVRRLPCAPVLAALESLPVPGLQVLKCHAFDKAAATAAKAATAAAAAGYTDTVAAATIANAPHTNGGKSAVAVTAAADASAAAVVVATAASLSAADCTATATCASEATADNGQSVRLVTLPVSCSSSSSAASSSLPPPLIVCAPKRTASEACDLFPGSIKLNNEGSKHKQPSELSRVPEDGGMLHTARLLQSDLAGTGLDLDLESDPRFLDLVGVRVAAAEMLGDATAAATTAVADAGVGRGGEVGGDGPWVAEAPGGATARRDEGVRATKGHLLGSGESLRLALMGSSCSAESVDADPWVSDVTLAAFRIISRLLFACATPLSASNDNNNSSNRNNLSPSSPKPTSRHTVLPALSIRPFERNGGRGPSSRAAGAASTTLRGPYAGAWMAALAPLGAAGLSAVQLRNFEFEAGDLQLLQVAVPELRTCELRSCPAVAQDVWQLRSWLQRPGWGGELSSDLHDPPM